MATSNLIKGGSSSVNVVVGSDTPPGTVVQIGEGLVGVSMNKATVVSGGQVEFRVPTADVWELPSFTGDSSGAGTIGQFAYFEAATDFEVASDPTSNGLTVGVYDAVALEADTTCRIRMAQPMSDQM